MRFGKMMFAGLTFMIASLLLAGCNRDFREYSDADLGFSIEYPVGWMIKRVDQEGIAIKFESPAEDANDGFQENISVSAGEYVREVSPHEFSVLSMMLTRSVMKNVVIRKEGAYAKGKMKGYFIDYTALDFEGNERLFHQVFFVRRMMLYSIISAIEEKKAEKYFPVIDKVVDSFRLK